MRTLTIDDDVFAELEKLTTPLFSHGDVIRKLLKPRGAETQPALAPVGASIRAPEKGSLIAYVQSADYRMLTNGINKYLAVLGWLYKTYPNDFQKVDGYRRGNRVYFARTQKAVEEGGKGAINAKRIPNSPVWTLATLDNRSKRVIISDLLTLFGFSPDEIATVVSTIADSGRHRRINLDEYQ